jgi:hypothetical protein
VVRPTDQARIVPRTRRTTGAHNLPVVRQTDQEASERQSGPVQGAAGRPLVGQADQHEQPRALVIGCGALARELLEVAARIPGLEIACLPPDLHNRPGGIPGAVRRRIGEARRDGFERIFIAYADCGTGGLLEPVLAEEGVERLPGAHCYEVFAGSAAFAAMADAEPGTFWLTDFLARNFERLVIRGLGIDRHPQLLATYFAHYTRVVFLSQTDDPDLFALAQLAADRLGLSFEHRPTGTANLAAPILDFARRASAIPQPSPFTDARGSN